MNEFISLHDAEALAEEAKPVPHPGLLHIFAGMIRHPIETLGEAIDHPIQSYAVALAALGGLYWALNLAIAQAGGGSIHVPLSLPMLLLVAVPAGIGYLFALAILLNWSCDIMGGHPDRKKIRAALAYVGVPGVIALIVFGIPKLVIFGSELFAPGWDWMSANPVLVWVLLAGDAMCFIWSLLLVVKAFKMINGFGTAKAVVAILLPLAPIVFIGLLFMTIAWTGIFFSPPAY